MSKTMQQLFFERLEARLPEGFSLSVDYHYANTGTLRVHRTGTFDPVTALIFHFNGDYATFDMPSPRDVPGLRPIGDRQEGKSFPYVTFNEIESRVIGAIINEVEMTEEVPNAR